MASILFIDNEDSFVYNLVDAYASFGHTVEVYRNDWPADAAMQYVGEEKPDLVVLSPGPNSPAETRVCMELLESIPVELPVFGVCLGFQCIVQHFGGSVVPSGAPVHGKASSIRHDASPHWDGVENPFAAGRYHSLIADTIPRPLIPSAWMGEWVMAVRHESRPIFGVQFHPESILTPLGQRILDNVITVAGKEPEISANGTSTN